MKLSTFKTYLRQSDKLLFSLQDGTQIPEHFHVTELGLITKIFIDCGGTVRNEQVANFQLWNASDFDHRLKPEKLLKIIDLAKPLLGEDDLEIEMEYQTDTIGKYGLDFNGKNFILTSRQTTCLAGDNCGAPAGKQHLKLSDIHNAACCTPGTGCC
jgi:hypothetical protein